jgi:hypothetical protein
MRHVEAKLDAKAKGKNEFTLWGEQEKAKRGEKRKTPPAATLSDGG